MAFGHHKASDSFSLFLDRSLCVLITDTAYHSSASILTSTCTCPQHRAEGEGKGKQIGVEGEKYTLLVKKNTLKSPGEGCRNRSSVDPPKYHCWYKKKGTKLYLPRNNPDRSPIILYSWRCPLGWGLQSNPNTYKKKKKKSCLYLLAWHLA